MSTKFNRNNENALDDEFYLSPDYRDDLNGVEEDLRDHTGDFHPTPCIISGLDCSTDDNADVDVSAGVAYDEDGYRIEVPQDQTGIVITLDGNPNWICVRHRYEYSRYPTDRRAVRTGAVWNNRKADSFEIVVRDSGTWPQPGDVTLVKATFTGGVIVFDTSDRTSPDFGGEDASPPGKVTNVLAMSYEDFQGGVDQDNVKAIKDTFPVPVTLEMKWARINCPAGVDYYEVLLGELNYQGEEVQDSYQVLTVAEYEFGSQVEQHCQISGMRAGRKIRIRVRAVDILGQKGSFSDPVDITLGWETTSALMMSAITVVQYSGGVKVSWNDVTSAYGYELFMTEGASPPEPDPSNRNHFAWRGPATTKILKATPGNTVKVVARCYDKWGRYSSNTTSGSASAGTPS